MKPTSFGVLGPGFLNEVPTLGSRLRIQQEGWLGVLGFRM